MLDSAFTTSDAVASARAWHSEGPGRRAVRRPEQSDAAQRELRFAQYVRRPLQRFFPLLFATVIVGGLAFGWFEREERYLTPEEGIGYWLGVVGATMMFALLLYPMRKRFRALQRLGSVASWFRLHMLLGIVGPTLILFHANFRLDSLNATVATVAMLIVVASGVVGRYLYQRLHMGLYGRKAEVREILEDIVALKDVLGTEIYAEREFMAGLAKLQACLPNPSQGLVATSWSMLRTRAQSRRAMRHLTRISDGIIRRLAREHGWTRREQRRRRTAVREHLAVLRAALTKAGSLAFYARLFSLWHHLHLPLFLFLVISAVLHVIAVHLY